MEQRPEQGIEQRLELRPEQGLSRTLEQLRMDKGLKQGMKLKLAETEEEAGATIEQLMLSSSETTIEITNWITKVSYT